MRLLLIIVIIIVLIALAVAQAIKFWNRIIFTFKFKGLDFSTLNFGDLASLGQTTTKLLMNVNIENRNNFSIPFDKMKVWLYYDNTLIAESSGNLYAQSFTLPAKGSIDITDYVNVYLNKAVGNLAKQVAGNNRPQVAYTVKINVFGIYLTYSDYFIAEI